MHTPPEILDGAKVLEYAIVDGSVKYTDALHLFHGETRVGPSAALAICEDPSIDGLLLFHCAEDWSVLGAQIWNEPPESTIRNVQEVKLKAERYYSGIGKRWVRK
jgi:hypothetical protein